jgi:hypothetical protein
VNKPAEEINAIIEERNKQLSLFKGLQTKENNEQ